MMPDPEPEPLGPLTSIITTDGRTFWATFSIDPVAAVWAVELPDWVRTGDDSAGVSWVDVQIAAPPTPAAPPMSRLAATTDAASLPRARP
jgi:hypothetical protein